MGFLFFGKGSKGNLDSEKARDMANSRWGRDKIKEESVAVTEFAKMAASIEQLRQTFVQQEVARQEANRQQIQQAVEAELSKYDDEGEAEPENPLDKFITAMILSKIPNAAGQPAQSVPISDIAQPTIAPADVRTEPPGVTAALSPAAQAEIKALMPELITWGSRQYAKGKLSTETLAEIKKVLGVGVN